MNPAVHAVEVLRIGQGAGTTMSDVAATEEPLELRLGGLPFVVIMRTPGFDRDLAAGFLLSEQLVREASDITSMRHCVDEDGRDADNVMNVWLAGDAATRAAAAVAERRHVTANSACGVCGRRSIDDLMEGVRRVVSDLRVPRATVSLLPDRLRVAQKTFDETGGLHAAGLFDVSGALLVVAEDVGRHNAVDKVIGSEMLAGRVPLSDRILFVSGRTSFEIVQKAVVAGVPVVASVSAPSSLAIELAREAHVTLLGFVRGGHFNIYAGAERIVL